MLTDSAPDYDYGDYIPSTPATGIEEYIRTNYPDARITEIDYEHGMTEVDIIDGRTPRELLFDGSGARGSTPRPRFGAAMFPRR